MHVENLDRRFVGQWTQTNCSFLWDLWTPSLWDGSYALGSVCLFICSFLRVSIFFLKDFFDVRGLGNFTFWEKCLKVQKCPQNRVFGLSKKMKLLVLSGNDLKWKSLWFFWFFFVVLVVLQKLHIQESSSF